jgi:hypothetical protein
LVDPFGGSTSSFGILGLAVGVVTMKNIDLAIATGARNRWGKQLRVPLTHSDRDEAHHLRGLVGGIMNLALHGTQMHQRKPAR